MNVCYGVASINAASSTEYGSSVTVSWSDSTNETKPNQTRN